MYRRILVPLDGSACGQAAFRHALRLAKDQHAGINIIHILDTQSIYLLEAGMYLESVVAQWRDVGQRLIDRAAEQARQEGIVVTAAMLEDSGRVPDVIVAESKRWPADVIVMGTHGHHGIEHLLLGSVAEGVVRTSSVPVLLIRQE